MTRILAFILCFLLASPALAQEMPEEESSFFVSFVENQLSGPNRQIRIQGIRGALSSNATIGQITVADDEGVWLRIVNASIVWSRSTLLLRQRLQINRLAAERIEVLRTPIPDESLPAPEAGGFAVPELPLAINLDELDVPLISFGPTVFGLESEMSIAGRIALADGALDTALQIVRLDGPGGQLALEASYDNATEILDLDLNLAEPENGIVANLLDIEGRPPVSLAVVGQGPLSALDVQIALDADEERVLAGIVRLREQAEGLGFAADLRGPIARLVPPRFRDFFGDETALTASGLSREAGGFRLDALDLESAALSLSASADTSSDGFLTALVLDATVDDGTDDRVVLPVPGGATSVQRAELTLRYGGDAGEEWSGTLAIDDLISTDISARRTELAFGGLAENLDDPLARRLTFGVDGALAGIVATDAAVQAALGEEITLDVAGEWMAGEPVRLDRAAVAAEALEISLLGAIDGLVFDGQMAVEAGDIAPFSALAGRDLSGALELRAEGTVEPVTGAFDLTIDSAARELRIDDAVADSLLAGVTTITGRVARGAEGLTADELRIGNEQVELLADGTFASGAADFTYELSLADLALVADQAEGRVEASGRAFGADGLINLTTTARAPAGRLAGRTLREALIAFEGTLEDGDLDGALAASAFLDGVLVELSSDIALDEESRRLTGLSFTAGGARASGDLVQYPSGLLDGELTIDAADISTAAALALVEASGAIEARISLSADAQEERQNASLSGEIRNLRVDETVLSEARFEAEIADLFSVPLIEGSLAARGLEAGGVSVTRLDATARAEGQTTNFSADAALADGVTANLSGQLSPEGEGYRLVLDEAMLGRGDLTARLLETASLLVVGDTVEIDGLVLDVGGGRISATGRVAQTVDVTADITRFPLAIANLVVPDLELGGTVDAELRATGPRERPDIAFDLQARAITAAALRQAGQSSISIEARGRTSGERVEVNASLTSPEGLRASVQGSAPLGDGNLALDVNLAAFPLGAVNAMAPGQELSGTLSGSARVTGTVADPQATFDLRAGGIGAAPLRQAGIASLDAAAAGRFADETVTLSSATVTGPQGLSLTASGTVPLSGPGLALNLSGQAPLALANQFLADRGTQVTGTAQLSGTVSGSIDDPVLRGTVSTAGAQVIDPETNVGLRNINISASIDGDNVVIQSANADLVAGGSISASGSVSINADAGFPADLRVALNQARYADGDLVVATASGNLALTGALIRDPLLSGNVFVERAEISVPENLGGGAAAIDVIHRNPPPGVARTLERARATDGTPVPVERPTVLRLDVNVSAPNRIFVRGRGLDAELGGEVRLTGPATSIQPVGGFEMIRGRLSILGQRITFDEGTVTLIGDLDPFLNFIARSESGDTTVFITVSGRASNLDISFSSQPELPEDEVLARLIFNRGIGELSPLQIAQLAAAAAELAGGGNSSLLGSLRQATGLDDLDIVTDSEGNAAVRAGRYIQENIYLGVEAGAGGTTRGTINLDITDELRARGAVGTDGDTSLGIFFERDY